MDANLVEVAALVGDTARARMLSALMGGQSLTATELAYCAKISRSTASGHLSKLVAGPVKQAWPSPTRS
jgi:DNA-binding transcriptional ArsR family regulator